MEFTMINNLTRLVYRRGRQAGLFSILPAVALSSGALSAQEQSSSVKQSNYEIEEVVVTARRKYERLQDVPLTVNVVSADKLSDLNIRKLEDISSVVPGLTLEEDSIAPNASLRGVRFDTFASGNNPTVEFYLNDSPIVSLSAVQSMFDIAQVEVLRGPQGTLRGRASPSGAITLKTQRPNLEEFEGYIDLTTSSVGGRNGRFAVSTPLVEEKLALRLAGFYERNDGESIKSINSSESSEYEGGGYRLSLRYEPLDTLSVNLMYQRLEPKRLIFTPVESANRADASQPAPAQGDISATDRKAVSDIPQQSSQIFERTGLELAWETAGLRLNYAGSVTDQFLDRKDTDDAGDVFGPGSDPRLQNLGQELETKTAGFSQEVRLAPVSLIDGIFDYKYDYVVGALYQKNQPATKLLNPTAVFLPSFLGGGLATVVNTPITSKGESIEKSVFANLTVHLSEATELAVGLRYIDYQNESEVKVSGATISSSDDDWTETIYSASLKHQYTDNLMGYVSLGSSWRPGINVVGNFSASQSDRERSFQELDPETSHSLEVGAKSDLMDGRLRLNGALFYQKFNDFPYRAGGTGVHYVTRDGSGTRSVDNFNFVAAVPVDVYGLEVESQYQLSEQWNVGALVSYAKGEIDNGTIPCNDYAPADGNPDSGGNVPTVAQIDAATGNQNVGSCKADFRSNFAPLWTATFSSEYGFKMGDLDSYLRGLLTVYGESKNDPTNNLDDVDSYSTLNLYAGVRDPEAVWEVMFYGKNVFEAEEVLSREASPASVGVQVLQPPTFTSAAGDTRVSTYRQVSLTPEREFGVNVRYNF